MKKTTTLQYILAFCTKRTCYLPGFDDCWQSTWKICFFVLFFQEMLKVSKLQRSLTDVRKLFQLSDTEITTTLVGFSCFRHIYMHLLSGRQPPTSLSVPATEAQNNNGFPSQEALWWEGVTDVSHWRMIRCLSWWRRRLDLAPFLCRARGHLVCCEQKWPKHWWWILQADKSSCQI